MSAIFNYAGELQPPYGPTAVVTGGVDILVPTGGGIYYVERIALANNSSSDCEITLQWNDGTSNYLYAFVDVVAKKTEYVDFAMPIGISDTNTKVRKLRAVAEADSRVTATVSYALVDLRRMS